MTGSRKTPTVLVVDDDAESCRAMLKVLEGAGYTTNEAHSGEQGLDLILKDGIDVLVTDLRLPAMDGLELLKRTKASDPEIEVILTTGDGTVQAAAEAIKEGAYDFILKPVRKAQLLRAVEKASERQYLYRENKELRAQLGQTGVKKLVYARAEMRNGNCAEHAMLASNEMKDATRTCARLVGFEERAASLYLTLARRFADNKDLSWFWLTMSMEEKQHAQLLEFCGCEQLVEQGLPEKSTVQALATLLGNLEERAGQKDLSLDEAFLLAAELEGSEINDVYAGVIKPIQGTWYIMRKKIETLLSDHMEPLVKAARKFGASATTLARLSELKRPEGSTGR